MGQMDAINVPCEGWQALREVYTARFGPLLKFEAEYDFGEVSSEHGDDVSDPTELDLDLDLDEEAMDEIVAAADDLMARSELDDDEDDDEERLLFWELTFGAMTEEDPRTVLASCGAAGRAGYELFLASAVPFSGFAGVLKALVREHAPLAPGMVIPMKIWSTSFHAVLLAPVGAGSIAIGDRLALNVVPLTRAEAELGADSVERLVGALRSAGALEVTDPLRDCTLVPAATQRYWAFARPLLLADTERRLEQRSKRLARLLAAAVPSVVVENDERLVVQAQLLLRHIRARPVDAASPAERDADLLRRRAGSFDALVQHMAGVFERGEVPSALRSHGALLVAVTMATHPAAQRLLLQAEEAPEEDGERFDVEALLARLVKLIRESRPDADPAALLAGGRQGHALALEEAVVADGFVPTRLVWEYVVWGMVSALSDGGPEDRAAASSATIAGLEAGSLLLLREDERPPMERLKDVVTGVLVRMAKVWMEALGVGAPSEEETPAPSAPPGKSRRGKRKPKKPGEPPTYH